MLLSPHSQKNLALIPLGSLSLRCFLHVLQRHPSIPRQAVRLIGNSTKAGNQSTLYPPPSQESTTNPGAHRGLPYQLIQLSPLFCHGDFEANIRHPVFTLQSNPAVICTFMYVIQLLPVFLIPPIVH